MKNQSFFAFVSAFAISVSACGSDQGRLPSVNSVDKNSFSKVQEDSITTLLQKYVTEERNIKYKLWLDSAEDLQSLKAILSAMSAQDLTGKSADEIKAFYINAYNLMTIDLILSNYDETLGKTLSRYPNQRSIRNIKNLDGRVWDEFKWVIA